jgi:hypothetical protein
MTNISLFYILQNIKLKAWLNLPSGARVVLPSQIRLCAMLFLLTAGN